VTFLAVILLGAICGLDVVSFPQIMISRPIVASTASAALVGRPAAGLVLGAVLELMALDTLPFGASRYPEWGSAAVVGGALSAMLPRGTPGAIPAGLLAALATAGIGQWSMSLLRRRNAQSTRAAWAAIDAGSGEALVGLQLRGLTTDLVRAGALTAAALVAFRPAVTAIVGAWTVDVRVSHALATGVAAMLAVGALWNAFRSTRGTLWAFGVGLLAGLGLVVLQ
jgi:PTS system mannose-specific IIC component